MPVSAMNAMRTADAAEIHARKIKIKRRRSIIVVACSCLCEDFFLLFFFLSFIGLVSLVKIGVSKRGGVRVCVCYYNNDIKFSLI